jgi:hypothetical protein
LLGLERTGLSRCLHYTLPTLDPELPPFPSPLAAVCTAPVRGPMGLPGIGEPLPVDPGRAAQEPSAFWYEQIADPGTMKHRFQLTPDELVLLGRKAIPPPRGPFRIIVRRIQGNASEDAALREIRARRSMVQRCIDLDWPYISSAEHVVLLDVDRDGVASPPRFQRRAQYGVQEPSPSERDYRGRELSERCLVGALEGLRLGEPDPTSSTFEVKLASPRE